MVRVDFCETSSTIVFLGMSDVVEAGVGAGSNALAMRVVFICMKVVIAALPKAEKEQVVKSKAPADSNSLNDSLAMLHSPVFSNLNQIVVSCICHNVERQ